MHLIAEYKRKTAVLIPASKWYLLFGQRDIMDWRYERDKKKLEIKKKILYNTRMNNSFIDELHVRKIDSS